MRDRTEFNWDSKSSDTSYKSIRKQFSNILEEQNDILQERLDIEVFCRSIKSFPNLKSIHLSFDGSKEFGKLWFACRAYVKWKESFPIHLEAILRSMSTAQKKGVQITTLQVKGFYAHLDHLDKEFLDLAQSALAQVSNLELVDSVSLLRFLGWIELKHIRILYVGNCYFMGQDLANFVCHSAPSLRLLILEKSPVYESSLKALPLNLDVMFV